MRIFTSNNVERDFSLSLENKLSIYFLSYLTVLQKGVFLSECGSEKFLDTDNCKNAFEILLT